MSSNYPGGSMVGSGIDDHEIERDVYCNQVVDGPESYGEPPIRCSFEGTVTVTVRDFGQAFWTCPDCEIENELLDF